MEDEAQAVADASHLAASFMRVAAFNLRRAVDEPDRRRDHLADAAAAIVLAQDELVEVHRMVIAA